jgi:geranylgeranyl pyrophosphate synthase
MNIELHLKNHLQFLLPLTNSKEVYQYALFPSGKLFRASLVWSVLQDLNPILYQQTYNDPKAGHALLASSIECHHTYTLLHDDLPSMDNDITRRGRPCTHVAFTEWEALLTGDGLLVLSFQLLSKIIHLDPARFIELLSFYSWATGPKGLIQGQYLDLSLDRSGAALSDLNSVLHIHKLKTARLIQVAILGSCILAISKDRKKEKLLWRFSRDLGVNFQLLDDLSELSEFPLSTHEKNINPWFLFPHETLNHLSQELDRFEMSMKDLNLLETKKIVVSYYEKMLHHFENNLKLEFDISPIIFRLKRFCN